MLRLRIHSSALATLAWCGIDPVFRLFPALLVGNYIPRSGDFAEAGSVVVALSSLYHNRLLPRLRDLLEDFSHSLPRLV